MIRVRRGDTVRLSDGREFLMAESATFSSDAEIEDFLCNSVEVQYWERSCLSKTVVKRVGLVARPHTPTYGHRVG